MIGSFGANLWLDSFWQSAPGLRDSSALPLGIICGEEYIVAKTS